MTQSATRIANVKWNISVPPDFDEATRLYLASQGGKKGSLSSLVQKAVSLYILSSLTGEAKEKNPLFSQVVPIGMTRMVIDENHYEDICRLLADALLSHDTNAV